jgi:hypothetical protein
MANDLTRDEFREQLAAFERRLVERLDLLERLIALGFDDVTDQIRMLLGDPAAKPGNPAGPGHTANVVLGNGRN